MGVDQQELIQIQLTSEGNKIYKFKVPSPKKVGRFKVLKELFTIIINC
jgi:hypothetical protein